MTPQLDPLDIMRSKTQASRVEYLNQELANCFASLREAKAEADAGRTEAAKKRGKVAEDGYANLVRFLAEIESEAERTKIEQDWNQLRGELDDLHVQLKEQS